MELPVACRATVDPGNNVRSLIFTLPFLSSQFEQVKKGLDRYISSPYQPSL